MSLYNEVRSAIIKERLIQSGDNVIVALSGGPDSVFLFHILKKYSNECYFKLFAAHVNHMYRGESADRDEQFCSELCSENDIELYIRRKNADEYAKEIGLSSEEAGRKLRYDFFHEIAATKLNSKIAVAHNKDDQVETVLQRLIRGTGIDGLAAMGYKNNQVIRPILKISKRSIIEYLDMNNISYCIDHTNNLPIYGRNKIRLNLLPNLEKNYNPNIRDVLYRLSENMRDDKIIIQNYIEKIYQNVLVNSDENRVVLDMDKITQYQENEISRILRRAIFHIKGSSVNVERKHINNALDLIKSNKTGKKIDFADDITISINYNHINIVKGIEKIGNFLYNVSIFDDNYINEINKIIRFEVIDKIPEIDFKSNEVFYFDLDKIKGDIVIRNRRPGDSIVPFGMSKNKKLKDILIDMKIAREERTKKMILADEEKILWLEDFRISELCKITEDTKKVLKLIILED